MVGMTRQMHDMFRMDKRHYWLRDADLTYCAARYLILSDDLFFRPSGGYLLHLAVEKYFKAIRTALRPQIPERKGGHDLSLLHSSLIKYVQPLNTPEVQEAIEKVQHLENWRYVDSNPDQTRLLLEDALAHADFLVAKGRSAIPSEVRFQGLRRILQLTGDHRRRLIEAVFKNNAQRNYWKGELLGNGQELDITIGKYLKSC